MENIKQKLRRSLLYLLGFSAFPMLTSCYGTPEDYVPYPDDNEPTIHGGKVVSSEFRPIKGIKITYKAPNNKVEVVYSNRLGDFAFEDKISVGTMVTASDIDGKENGGEFESVNSPASEDFIIMLELKDK